MNQRLSKDIYRMGAPKLAPFLLGKLLCRRKEDEIMKLRITETECYCGESDTACHASKGRTPRTETLYMEGGTIYVYLCYGIHHLFNVVAGTEGFPEAVLIRGVEGAEGPGKLTRMLGIDLGFNRTSLADSPELWIEDDGCLPEYLSGPRVGINYAAAEDIARPWRFVADNHQLYQKLLKKGLTLTQR